MGNAECCEVDQGFDVKNTHLVASSILTHFYWYMIGIFNPSLMSP
jgi:hypothetical protein